MSQSWGPTADVQWRTVDGPETNQFYDGTGYRTLTGQAAAWQQLGNTVCRYGINTGTQCTWVTMSSYTPTWDGACHGSPCSPTWMRTYGAATDGGDSQMTRRASLSAAAGRVQYLRSKGAFWVELVRSWVMPGAAAGAFAKYLGVHGRWAVAVAVIVPVVVEVLGFLMGRFLYRHGGVQADYRMAYEADAYKVESVAELRKIRETLQERLPADP